MPSPIALRALSWKSPLSINKLGAIILHAQEEGRSIVERRVHDVDSAEAFRCLRSEVVSSAAAPHILSTDKLEKNGVVVFTPSHLRDGTTTVYAQPLQEAKSPRISPLCPTLNRFAPKDSSSVAFFNPRTKDCVFVDQNASAPIALFARQGFTDFAAIPVYDINDDPRAKWQIGLTEVASVPELITVKTLNPLPTPPASPRPRPRQNVSFVLPLEEEPKQQDTSERNPSRRTNGHASVNESSAPSASGSNEDDRDAPLPSPSPDAPGATSLALLSKAQQSLVHRAQVTLGDGRLFATFSILAWLVGVFVQRVFRAFLPLGVQSRLDGLVWYLLPRATGSGTSTYAQRRRRIERRRTDESARVREGEGETPRLREIINYGGAPASYLASANEETTTHLFIDPVPLTTSPGTIEEAEYMIPVPSPPSPPSSLPPFAPSRTESTKAARWNIPASGEHDRHGGDPSSVEAAAPAAEVAEVAAASNSTLHLLVHKPLVSGGAAAPHDALYVEVDGSEFPLGPDLLLLRRSNKSNQGRRALETQAKATISEDTASPTSPCSVYAIKLPEGVQARGTSVLVRLRA